MPKRSKAKSDAEDAGPKRRSERLQAKPQTLKSESTAKKAPAKPRKVKEGAEVTHGEETETPGCPGPGAPAENGEEASAEAEDEQGKREKKRKAE